MYDLNAFNLAFAYLDAVREEGSVNMFGAGRLLADEMDASAREVRPLVQAWMTTFSEGTDSDARALEAFEAQ